MMLLTHISFALFLGSLMLKAIVIPVNKYIFLAVILLASFLPDIVNAHSFVGKRFKVLGLFFKHRGFFHSIILMVIFAIIVFLFTQNLYYVLAIMVGFASHLLLDSMTKTGITPFWPSKLRIKGIFRTRRWLDWVSFIIFLILDVLLLI